MRNPLLVQVTGVLAPFAQGFGARLERLGYARPSRAGHLRLTSGIHVRLVIMSFRGVGTRKGAPDLGRC
jgi:hypothetical protein